MTTKDAKAYLMQYRESLERADEIEQHLHELKAEAIRLKDHEGRSVALDGAVQKYVDACNNSEAELNRLAALRAEIIGTIDAVKDDRLRNILRRRYILGQKWEQIAVSLMLEYRWVLRLHGRALTEVSKTISKTDH
jgi:DNA-directed RNA polymerase specialized sigma subunit